MAFVDKRVQLFTNYSLATPANQYLVASNDVDLGATPVLRGQATSGCYLVVAVVQNVTTSDSIGDPVQLQLQSSDLPAGQGAVAVHWNASNVDFTDPGTGNRGAGTGPLTAGGLFAGRTFVVPLPPKAEYRRYLQVVIATDIFGGDVFVSGVINAYLTTTPYFTGSDLMPQGFSAKV